MSVSIYVEQVSYSRREIPCHCLSDGEIDSGCYVCSGTGRMEETVYDPEPLNLSNSNAASVFSLLGIRGDSVYAGSVTPSEIADLRRRILHVINAQGEVESAVRPTHIEYTTRVFKDADGLSRIERAPRLFSMGIDSEYIVNRLRQIDELLRKAQEKDCGIYWG